MHTFFFRVAVVVALSTLTGCQALEQLFARLGSSTLITYRPIGYCPALVDDKASDGGGPKSVLRHEALIIKIVSIENRQPAAVELRPPQFFLDPLPRLATNPVAQRLTTLPPSVIVPRGATLSNPGIVAIPVDAESSPDVFEAVLDPQPDGSFTTGYVIHLSGTRLRHAPDSPDDAGSYVSIDAGRRTIDASRQEPCTMRLVDEWVLSR